MNPFDYYGPQFLVFYAGLTIATLFAMSVVRRTIDHNPDAIDDRLTDPYLIALLRAGDKEMIRVTIVSLLDRGLLEIDGAQVRTSEVGTKTRARRNVEHLILQFCRESRELSKLVDQAEFSVECVSQESLLRQMGLMPSESQRRRRVLLFLIGGGFLAAVSMTKILIAFSRGRTNVLFLVFATLLAVFLAKGVALARLTARGEAKLRELRNLFQSLKLRARELKPGGSTSEVAMLAAVYGPTELPRETYAWLPILYPRPQPSHGSSGDGSSSSGGSCGSSCGGGCGGGCGGCGS